jgi:hypothetical protein
MSKVVYWMTVSLDGFVETRDGQIDWTVPDAGLHRFLNESARQLGVFLHGRRRRARSPVAWSYSGTSAHNPQIKSRGDSRAGAGSPHHSSGVTPPCVARSNDGRCAGTRHLRAHHGAQWRSLQVLELRQFHGLLVGVTRTPSG